MIIPESELIINPDGTIFHLRMKPEHLASKVILVGDPDRVKQISSFFDAILYEGSNREFVWKTGVYNNNHITVLSTGIGTDNIDIVLTELDALANIDFKKRTVKRKKQSLIIVRLGTSGTIQANIPVDSWLISQKAIGMDGLLYYYNNNNMVRDIDFENKIMEYIFRNNLFAMPNVVDGDKGLIAKLVHPSMFHGVTISATGFYGPQGREVRLKNTYPSFNEKIAKFEYKGLKITNYEMECSAIYGLSALMGHKAVTICVIIANRPAGTFSKDYNVPMKKLIEHVLNAITSNNYG